MKRRGIYVLLCAGLVLAGLYGQAIEPGAPTLFTPDPAVNRAVAGKPVSEVDLIRYQEGPDGLTIDPQLPPHWNWVAGRGFTYKEKPVEFFFWNGMLYTNASVKYCSFRVRKYPNLITDKVRANTFVMAMQKEDETVIFTATEEPVDVHLVIDASVFGEEKMFDYHLGAGQGELIRMYPPGAPDLP